MSLTLTPPEVFSAFPYSSPYPIQAELMQHLYKSIEHRKVSIVESPTGTVSLSFLSRESVALVDRYHTAGQDTESLVRESYLVV